MTGLEKIIEDIEKVSKEEVSAILKKAEGEAAEIKNAADKEIKSETAAAEKELEKRLADQASRAEFAAQLKQKQMLLAEKQEIITGVLTKALEKVNTLPDGEYFDTILKMVKGIAHGEKGEICFSAKDLKRIPAGFAEQLKAALPAGGELTVSDKAADIKSGFILKYGDIEENGSFENILEARKNELQDKVRELLF